jgi:hypothetical protein
MSKSVMHRHKEDRMDEPRVVYDSANPTLSLKLTINVVRVKRRRCPRCGNVRVLYRLTAFGDQAVGDGPLLCGRCGGLR